MALRDEESLTVSHNIFTTMLCSRFEAILLKSNLMTISVGWPAHALWRQRLGLNVGRQPAMAKLAGNSPLFRLCSQRIKCLLVKMYMKKPTMFIGCTYFFTWLHLYKRENIFFLLYSSCIVWDPIINITLNKRLINTKLIHFFLRDTNTGKMTFTTKD